MTEKTLSQIGCEAITWQEYARLNARVAELETALKPFADEVADDEAGTDQYDNADVQIKFIYCRAARAALSKDT